MITGVQLLPSTPVAWLLLALVVVVTATTMASRILRVTHSRKSALGSGIVVSVAVLLAFLAAPYFTASLRDILVASSKANTVVFLPLTGVLLIVATFSTLVFVRMWLGLGELGDQKTTDELLGKLEAQSGAEERPISP